MKLHFNLTMSIDELLQATEKLDELDLDRLVERILILKAKRKAPALPESETELLQQIDRGIPTELHQQYRDLVAKRDAQTLTDKEYELLLELSDRIELLAAERTGLLVKLAQLRQVPLMQLIDDLGIQTSYA
jgi:hypothetical protein